MTQRALTAAQTRKAALPSPASTSATWVRTCVGCRKRAPASELLRVVAVGEKAGPADGRCRLVPDPARRLPGRGAHLHPDPACLALAQRRRAFGRALRLSGIPDAGVLVELLDQQRRPDSSTPTARTGRPT